MSAYPDFDRSPFLSALLRTVGRVLFAGDVVRFGSSQQVNAPGLGFRFGCHVSPQSSRPSGTVDLPPGLCVQPTCADVVSTSRPQGSKASAPAPA